jgi:hypothetical protein
MKVRPKTAEQNKLKREESNSSGEYKVKIRKVKDANMKNSKKDQKSPREQKSKKPVQVQPFVHKIAVRRVEQG